MKADDAPPASWDWVIGAKTMCRWLRVPTMRVPTRPAAEISGVIESQHGRLFEGRCEKRGSGVGLVMLYHGDLRFRELVAQDTVNLRFRRARERPHHRHAVHLLARGSRQAQALGDRRVACRRDRRATR